MWEQASEVWKILNQLKGILIRIAAAGLSPCRRCSFAGNEECGFVVDMGLTQNANQSIIFINDNNSQLKNA